MSGEKSLALFYNTFLPTSHKNVIAQECKLSEESMGCLLEQIDARLSSGDDIEEDLLTTLYTRIAVHLDLKYYFSGAIRLRIIQFLLQVTRAVHQTSIITRTIAISLCSDLLDTKMEKLEWKTDWKPLWSELVKLTLENGLDMNCCTTKVANFLGKLSLFIFSARKYYNTDEDQITGSYGSVVDYALEKLADLRMPTCFEGILVLLYCFPQRHPKFHQLIPIFFERWAAFQQNAVWDQCWAQLLARIVKVEKSFDWTPYVPFLLTKLRESLWLPTPSAQLSMTTFPHVFPSHWVQLYVAHQEDQLQSVATILANIILFDNTACAAELPSITTPAVVDFVVEKQGLSIAGFNVVDGFTVSQSAKQLLDLMHTVRCFVHPSNTGPYSVRIASMFVHLLRAMTTKLGEHIGDIILSPEGVTADENARFPTQFSAGAKSTVLVISGHVLTYLLDGLGTAHNGVSGEYIQSMQLLLPLQPDIAHVMCTYFVESMEPKALQSSHRFILATRSLAHAVRSSLFPQPIILQYLPDILKWSLLGLEVSEPERCGAVMDMLFMVFSWIPVSTRLKIEVPKFRSYMELLDCSSSHEVNRLLVAARNTIFQAHYDDLVSFILDEWMPQVFDKIFSMIDAQEKKVKGVEISATSVGEQILSYIFESLEDPGPELEQELENKIMNYVLQRAPVHTDKTCARLIEYFLTIFPTHLNSIVRKILTPDVLSLSMTGDRLAFRLRILGGCFRQCHCTQLDPDLLQVFIQFTTNKAVLFHEEKTVRKFIGKVYKDFLKGNISTIMKRIYNILPNNRVLGAPNVPQSGDFQWTEPTAESINTTLRFTRMWTDLCIGEMRAALSTATSGNSSGSGAELSIKRCEEVIHSSLCALGRVIRGIAELLTEDVTVEEAASIHATTGRDAQLSLLSPEDREYVKSYRKMITCTLAFVHEQLEASAKGPINLRINVQIAKAWIKVFNFISTRRVTYRANEDTADRDYILGMQIGGPYLAAVIYKQFHKKLTIASFPSADRNNSMTTLGQQMRGSWFWKRHDWPVSALAQAYWSQHIHRGAIYSQHSFKVLSNRPASEDDPVWKCVNYLIDLTRHNYDEVHPMAREYLEDLLQYMSQKSRQAVARSLLDVLYTEHAGFYPIASTLVLLISRVLFDNCLKDLDITERFLGCLTPVAAAANEETEEEKRDIILMTLNRAMVQYTQKWLFTPRRKRWMQERLFPSCLAAFGATVSADPTTPVNWTTKGMRFDSYYCFFLLHMVDDHMLLNRPEWAVPLVRFIWYQLTTCHDQPTQFMSNCMLHIIMDIVYRASPSGRALYQAQPWFALLRQGLDPTNEQNGWMGFIFGQVRVVMALKGATSSVWTEGVDAVVANTSPYLRLHSLDRCHLRYDANSYSMEISHSFAQTVESLVDIGMIPVIGHHTVPPSEIFGAILFGALGASVLGKMITQNEQRAVNNLRSEVYCGLLRYYFRNPDSLGDDLNTTGQVLTSYLSEMTSASSVQFAEDWQEAAYLAVEAVRDVDFIVKSPLVQHVLTSFMRVVQMTGANQRSRKALQEVTGGDLEGDEDEQGEDVEGEEEGEGDENDMKDSMEEAVAQSADKDTDDYEMELQPIEMNRQMSTSSTGRGIMPPPPSMRREHSNFSSADLPSSGIRSSMSSSNMLMNTGMLTFRRQISFQEDSPEDGSMVDDGLTPEADSALGQDDEDDGTDEEDYAGAKAKRTPALQAMSEDQGGEADGEEIDVADGEDNKGTAPSSAVQSHGHGHGHGHGGFAFLDKAFMLLHAVVFGASCAALQQQVQNKVIDPHALALVNQIGEFLAQPDVDIIMAYTTSRSRLTCIIAIVAEFTDNQCPHLPRIYEKLLKAAVEDIADKDKPLTEAPIQQPQDAILLARSTSVDSPKRKRRKLDDDDGAQQQQQQQHHHLSLHQKEEDPVALRHYYAIESIGFLIKWLWNAARVSTTLATVVPYFLRTLVLAMAEPKNETVQSVMDTLLVVFAGALDVIDALHVSRMFDSVMVTLKELHQMRHTAWRVREVIVRLAILLLSCHWQRLTADQKLIVRDIVVQALDDPHRQVQDVAMNAMPEFLSFKTDRELQKIAEAYVRNSEKIMAKENFERRQRKLAALSLTDSPNTTPFPPSAATAAAAAAPTAPLTQPQQLAALTAVQRHTVDPEHLKTVQMMSCIVRARDFDVPSFFPSLIASFLRHTAHDATQRILSRTVRVFRESHQENWEQDLRRKFTTEQLTELQGAGAAHYFA